MREVQPKIFLLTIFCPYLTKYYVFQDVIIYCQITHLGLPLSTYSTFRSKKKKKVTFVKAAMPEVTQNPLV